MPCRPRRLPDPPGRWSKPQTAGKPPRRRWRSTPSSSREDSCEEISHAAKLGVPVFHDLFAVQMVEFAQTRAQMLPQEFGGRVRIFLRATLRLRNNAVDQAQFLQVFRGQSQRCRRLLRLGRIAIDDGDRKSVV